MTVGANEGAAGPRVRHARFGGLSFWGLAIAVAAALLLSACSTDGLNNGGLLQSQPPAQTLDTVGTGSVKVALLLPLSARGDAGATAKALKQAAELALFEFNNPDIVLVPKDTRGTAAGAAAAAQQAVAEGAKLIVGPLFAHSVAAAGPIARNANIPVIAFSTDANVAGRGVYLLSFLPSDEIAQIVAFAASQGKRSFAGLLPESAYGTVAEGALRQNAPNLNGQVVAVEKYPNNTPGMADPARRVAAVAGGANPRASAVLVPEGGNTLPVLAGLLAGAGVDTRKVKLLGSGQWDEAALSRQPALAGGWYPAPEPGGWQGFSGRYQKTYGVVPPRIASLSYDAISLAAALAQQPEGQRYSPDILTNGGGFSGVDGIFRFNTNGLNQRGLAILEVQANGSTRTIRPAPKTFAGRGL